MIKKIKLGYTMWARQTLESEIFFYKPDKWFKIWFYIVSKVNHKTTKLYKRWEWLIRYKDIMEWTWASKAQCEKCIKWLEKRTMMKSRQTTRWRMRLVLNYAIFQDYENYKEDWKEDLSEDSEKTRRRLGEGADKQEWKEWKNEKKTQKTDFEKTLDNFKLHRKQVKPILTDLAEKMLRNKLNKLADSNEDKIAILEQSIENGWKWIFELKDKQKKFDTDNFKTYSSEKVLDYLYTDEWKKLQATDDKLYTIMLQYALWC